MQENNNKGRLPKWMRWGFLAWFGVNWLVVYWTDDRMRWYGPRTFQGDALWFIGMMFVPLIVYLVGIAWSIAMKPEQ